MLIRKIILLVKFIELKIRKVNVSFSLQSNISLTADVNNKGSKLDIGKVYIRGNTSINTAEEGKLVIDDGCFFNRNCIVACREKITIGEGCIFGPNVCIYDHDHSHNECGVCVGYLCDEVIIEENCWIGAGAIILRGSHIRKNSIVAAGTVVRGEFEEGVLIYNTKEIKTKKLK